MTRFKKSSEKSGVKLQETQPKPDSTKSKVATVGGDQQKKNATCRVRYKLQKYDGRKKAGHVLPIGSKVLKFNNCYGEQNVFVGQSIGEQSSCNSMTAEIGNSIHGGIVLSTGQLVVVKKWVVTWKTDKAFNHDPVGKLLVEKILVIKRELTSYLGLNHPNLTRYLGLNHQCEPGKIIIYAIMEYHGGSNLSVLMRHFGNHQLPLNLLKTCTAELLQVLEYLHSNSVFHNSITPSNILIDHQGRLHLTAFSVEKRINELYSLIQTPQKVANIEVEPGNPDKDFHQLGALLSTLACIHSIGEIPDTFPSSMNDFLNLCLQKNRNNQMTATQLLDHPFLKESHLETQYIHDNFSGRAKRKADIKNMEGLENLTLPKQLRIKSEFEEIKVLGKGGFGAVYKVRNTVDGGVYAIKKIPLSQKSSTFNDKIMREVKLLSKLKHEHVVRYFCSWIEHSTEPPTSATPHSSLSSRTEEEVVKKDLLVLVGGCDLYKDVELFLPPVQDDDSSDWLPEAAEGNVQFIDPREEDDSSSSKTQNKDGAKNKPLSKMENINSNTEEPEVQSNGEHVVPILYIQMECCEERTLRNTIDEGLCTDMNRVWRLFREIVEGLAHIHDKDIIHRDLKPVNIFLDSYDHVKIGDFGLARTDNFSREGAAPLTPSPDSIDGSLTCAVGTRLYVSPEVMKHSFHYDQKVDIYSLGIIFFEMCYRALATEHERNDILNKLREATVDYPDDFDTGTNQAKVISWLLNHDPSKRPTAKELLASKLLPNEILRSTSQSELLDSLFSQENTDIHDAVYDRNIYDIMISWRTALLYQKVKKSLTSVFARHGAINIPLPLFMPKCKAHNNKHLVTLLDRNAGVICVPIDRRVPFARYIGRKNIQSMKRFAIEKALKDKKLDKVSYSEHPMEFTECVFDIVSSSQSVVPDAEVLAVVQEIIQMYPTLGARNYYVRINHMQLLQAMLLHCGIPTERHTQVLMAVLDHRNKDKKDTLVEEDFAQQLIFIEKLLKIESTINRMKDKFKILLESFNEEVKNLTIRALNEIKTIHSYAAKMGLKMQVKVTLGLIYKPSLYSGVIYQVMCDKKKMGKVETEVLASGGRYDKLISSFVPPSKEVHTHPSGVGITILLERLAFLVADDEKFQKFSPCDVVVLATHKWFVPGTLAVAKSLLDAGFKTDIHYDIPENNYALIYELIYTSQFKGISHIVYLLKASFVKVISLDRKPKTSINMKTEFLIDYLKLKRDNTSAAVNPADPLTFNLWKDIYSMDTSWTDI